MAPAHAACRKRFQEEIFSFHFFFFFIFFSPAQAACRTRFKVEIFISVSACPQPAKTAYQFFLVFSFSFNPKPETLNPDPKT
jgi:hypothetical protein